MSNIIIFGDSIARGAFDFEKSGWVSRLNTFLWKDNFAKTGCYYKGPEAYNFSMDGDIAEDIVNRFDDNIDSMPLKKQIIIFAIGLNDSSFVNQQERSTKSDFEKNIKLLIKKAQKIVKKDSICFIGITDIDSDIIKNDFKQERIKEFDNILQTAVSETRCKFIPMQKLLGKQDLADGYHPNAEGHKKMFERIKDFLIENGIA